MDTSLALLQFSVYQEDKNKNENSNKGMMRAIMTKKAIIEEQLHFLIPRLSAEIFSVCRS